MLRSVKGQVSCTDERYLSYKVKYFLFERASKPAGAVKLPFLNLASILAQKRGIFSNTPSFFGFSSSCLRH